LARNSLFRASNCSKSSRASEGSHWRKVS